MKFVDNFVIQYNSSVNQSVSKTAGVYLLQSVIEIINSQFKASSNLS